jgi:hypothetical protein
MVIRNEQNTIYKDSFNAFALINTRLLLSVLWHESEVLGAVEDVRDAADV